MATSTEKSNNASATAASSGSDLNGGAAAAACQKIRARLANCAATHMAEHFNSNASPGEVTFEAGLVFDRRRPECRLTFRELITIAYRERISLGERGFYATPGLHFDAESGTGSPFLYYTNGCSLSEVLIDRFTGEMRVLRSDLLMDIGKPINPGIDRGQITGGFI